MVDSWLISVTEPCWAILQNVEKFGFKKRFNSIKRGDLLIFYVVGSGKIKGVFKVRSNWREENVLIWADEQQAGRILYPYSLSLKRIAIGEVEFKKIIKELGFIKNKDAAYVYLRGTIANFSRPIPHKDFEVILKEMRKKQN